MLRATSPIHMQYLRNMGVGSSLSVSVVVGGQLWGLIACHHQTPYVLPPELRTTLEYLGRLLSLQVQVKRAYALQANSYLTKPSTLEDFLQLIERLTAYWFGTASIPQTYQPQ